MMGSYAEYPTTNCQNEGRGGTLAWNVPYLAGQTKLSI